MRWAGWGKRSSGGSLEEGGEWAGRRDAGSVDDGAQVGLVTNSDAAPFTGR